LFFRFLFIWKILVTNQAKGKNQNRDTYQNFAFHFHHKSPPFKLFSSGLAISDNGLRIKEVAEGNLGEGAKHRSLLSAVIRSPVS
jgi:hypothetical protein